jgi:glycosyltransferase involved in cell wall biosynthesis
LESPLISVITSCLNAEKTIRRTIESVIDQTYKNIEFIIIDGISTDKTLKIINEYNVQISHIISEKDNGISDAFNKGIKISNGEYIQILNADDYLPKDKIEKSINLLIKNPDFAYCYGDIILIDKNQKPLFEIAGDKSYKNKIRFSMPSLNHPTVIAKKSMFEKYGIFDTQWKYAMDYDWLLRLHKNMEVGVYSQEIKVYMQEGGESSKYWVKTELEQMHISIHNGYNSVRAFFVFIFKCFKISIRKFVSIFISQQLLIYFRPGKRIFNSYKTKIK